MNNKQYPLELENWGDDQYLVVSRGHHDLEVFKQKVNEEFDSWGDFFEVAYHSYFKAIPSKSPYSTCYYTPCSKNTRGAFPATVAQEGWTQAATDANFKEQSQ